MTILKLDKEQKKNILAISIGLIVGIAVGILLMIQTKSVHKDFAVRYQKFYSTNLDGKITYLDASGGRYYFKLNEGMEFFISPHNISDDQNSFYLFVDQGDYFIKPAFSDTVTIISNGQQNKYTFRDYSIY